MALRDILHFGKKPEHDKSKPRPDTHKMVHCPECGWDGTVAQSMVKNPGNDTCPECGNTELSYEI